MLIEVVELLDFDDVYDLIVKHGDENLTSFIRHVRDDGLEEEFTKLVSTSCRPYSSKEKLVSDICKDEFYYRERLGMDLD